MEAEDSKKEVRIVSAYELCSKIKLTKLPLVSDGPGPTLHQKKAREDLARYLNETPLDENAAATYLNTWRSVQQQEDLAMKLVKSPLHRSQYPEPQLNLTEQLMLKAEDRIIGYARTKIPGLWMLLQDKLMERFGPLYKPFVSQLVLNIMLQTLMTWLQHLHPLSHVCHSAMMACCRPTEESVKKELVDKFALATLPEAPVEEIVDELVKKMELAFADASTAEDAVTVGVHNISMAN